mmetsp:Transcript_31290/g.100356  ORF Transcript_31290/g.100356 Transcript_31290/m.100356 type:complete len:261 (+) Transcript_31290:4244-5026(+)
MDVHVVPFSTTSAVILNVSKVSRAGLLASFWETRMVQRDNSTKQDRGARVGRYSRLLIPSRRDRRTASRKSKDGTVSLLLSRLRISSLGKSWRRLEGASVSRFSLTSSSVNSGRLQIALTGSCVRLFRLSRTLVKFLNPFTSMSSTPTCFSRCPERSKTSRHTRENASSMVSSIISSLRNLTDLRLLRRLKGKGKEFACSFSLDCNRSRSMWKTSGNRMSSESDNSIVSSSFSAACLSVSPPSTDSSNVRICESTRSFAR